ncbi:hypothetical protein BGZ61DRAFT_39471 [Ilyonectria robusta]|uniref:uncharacterized protein n=1 Tax=Ilyonectria robusta TaxID=1079257 RepID=UPI001E8CE512|nr:uncharacterized protein BGZ61DRAFT_39471 [Ilyonectria robusta]KAH8688156.1 hypothetical protein BGZ61DRAFT_39471 [Ilyonectria robusta]
MAARGLSQIPTLTDLYQKSLLHAASSASTSSDGYPANSGINDHVGLIRGDITRLRLDAIVNAANSSLLGGGGVDGAIHRAAGTQLVKECATLGGCPTGEARITDGYDLPAKRVIHTVGPKYYYDEDPDVLLRRCYQNSLELAVREGVQTLAFSSISTGVYGYPSLEAAEVACETVRKFLDSDDGPKLKRVVFVTFEQKDVDAYNTLLPKFFPSN